MEPADIPHSEIGWGRLAAHLEDTFRADYDRSDRAWIDELAMRYKRVILGAEIIGYSKSWEQTRAILKLLGWEPKPGASSIGNETPAAFDLDAKKVRKKAKAKA